MRVRLLGFYYKLNYVPRKKAKAETNEADYNSRHPEPLTIEDTRATDNRPPFNGHDFLNFSTYLGFKHDRKTPKNPQANDEAEQFMRVLKKLYCICQLTG